MTLSIGDIVMIGGWILSILIYLFARVNILPKAAREWLDKIGGQGFVENLIVHAEQYVASGQKREWVVNQLVEHTSKLPCGSIPVRIANLIVEFVLTKTGLS